MELVVPAAAEHAVGPQPPKSESLPSPPCTTSEPLVAGTAIVAVAAQDLIGVRPAVEAVVPVATGDDVVPATAVGKVAAVGRAHAVVPGSGPNVVGSTACVHEVVPCERRDPIGLFGAAQHVVARRACDHGGCGDRRGDERSGRDERRECLALHACLLSKRTHAFTDM